MDEILCDEPSYLIWKWRFSGVQTGAGARENAIRWGSSLKVKEGLLTSVVEEPVSSFRFIFGIGYYIIN